MRNSQFAKCMSQLIYDESLDGHEDVAHIRILAASVIVPGILLAVLFSIHIFYEFILTLGVVI